MFLPKETNIYRLPAIFRKYKMYQNFLGTSPSAPMCADTIIRMKNDNRLFEYQVAIAAFLYHVRFATPKMIYEFYNDYLKKNPDIKKTFKLKENFINFESLLRSRIVSEFTISTEERTKKINEAKDLEKLFRVYVLDMGGKALVTNYREFDDIWDFKLTENYKSAERIAVELITTDFYLKLKDLEILNFNKKPVIYVGDGYLYPDFKLIIKNTETNPCFYGQVFFKNFNEEKMREILIRYESLETTNIWKKHSEFQPVYLFICEDEKTLESLSKLLDRTFIKRVRFTTFKRLKKPLWDVGCFLKKDDQDKEGRLIEVKSNHFNPEKEDTKSLS